jgi:hypothetical protein
VKYRCADDAEQGQCKCREAGLEAKQQGEAAADFQCDDQRQQLAGNAHRGHIGLGARVAGAQLADARADEDGCRQRPGCQGEGAVDHGDRYQPDHLLVGCLKDIGCVHFILLLKLR